LWREISFALHLISQAVNPRLELSKCLGQWQQIAQNLAEPPRKRVAQMHALGNFLG